MINRIQAVIRKKGFPNQDNTKMYDEMNIMGRSFGSMVRALLGIDKLG